MVERDNSWATFAADRFYHVDPGPVYKKMDSELRFMLPGNRIPIEQEVEIQR